LCTTASERVQVTAGQAGQAAGKEWGTSRQKDNRRALCTNNVADKSSIATARTIMTISNGSTWQTEVLVGNAMTFCESRGFSLSFPFERPSVICKLGLKVNMDQS
jgi:hypothetical protein